MEYYSANKKNAFYLVLMSWMKLEPIIQSKYVGLDGKESACSARDPGSIPGLGRSPGERNGNPLQYSRLENSMDTGAWQATVHGLTESDMIK